MTGYLKDYDLVGEMNTVYYNVSNKTYRENRNQSHASLFQTAFNIAVLPEFEKYLSAKFIDINFWEKANAKKKLFEKRLSVGIKGMSGRAGIGMGHYRNFRQKDTGEKLKELIGKDANQYV